MGTRARHCASRGKHAFGACYAYMTGKLFAFLHKIMEVFDLRGCRHVARAHSREVGVSQARSASSIDEIGRVHRMNSGHALSISRAENSYKRTTETATQSGKRSARC